MCMAAYSKLPKLGSNQDILQKVNGKNKHMGPTQCATSEK